MNLFPIVYAQVESGEALSFVGKLKTFIIQPILGIIFALAFVLFLWGVTQFMMHPEDDDVRTQGKNHMIWGLVGMFIMVSVTTIISIIKASLGL